MRRFLYMEQRTPEWFKAHCGRISGSRMGDLTAYSVQKARLGQELKARADYREELLAERLTGRMSIHFVTNEMKRGTEEEDYARSVYEVEQNAVVEQIGFAIHPLFDFAGASPDGIRDGRRVTEFKNLTTVHHMRLYVANSKAFKEDPQSDRSYLVPEDYRDQVLWTMDCCECDEADFVSFDSRLIGGPYEHCKMVIIPVLRDDKRIAELRTEAVKMNAEIEQAMKELAVNA